MFFFKKKNIPLNEFFPEGFIDIHSHLLPGIDDGATDLENSLELIKKMRAYGIKNFITTPHILGDLYPNNPEIITKKISLVKNELVKQGLVDISIKAAAEYMLDENFSKILDEGKLLTLKNDLVLVEMSYFSPPSNLFDLLFQMQLKGYKPVLAHPERYASYHNNFKIYTKLKNAGCLFQLNLLSLTSNYGREVKQTTEKLLKEKMYDVIGTDVHHFNHLNLFEKLSNAQNLKKLESLFLNNIKVFDSEDS